MEHERFYTSGTWSDPDLGVYGGWVAFQNSFADRQIFQNKAGDVFLVFAGECFADGEAVAALRHKGHEFAPEGGEWLICLYEEEGARFAERLNGLFSGLLVDKKRGRAFLFNDRYGIERIYWVETQDATYFASEAKALLGVLPQLRAFDNQGVLDFLTFGCVLEDRTLFRGVKVLPPGSVWSFDRGTTTKGRYFSPAEWEAQEPLTTEAFEAAFLRTFRRNMSVYFHADSQIGLSLTGGLDTRMILACRPTTARMVSYTYTGPGARTLDVSVGATAATLCGLEHHAIQVGPEFLSNFGTYADRTAYITDGNAGALGAHEIYLTQLARHLSPIRLTGVFGGEVLRGVPTLKPLGLASPLVDQALREPIAALERNWITSKRHPITSAAFAETPWNLFGNVAACRSQVTFRTPYLDNQVVALAFQCPPLLRRSARLAVKLLEETDSSLAQLPTDLGYLNGSESLRHTLLRLWRKTTFKLDYLSNEGLPDQLSRLDPVLDRFNSCGGILGHHKYLRYRRWFRRELAGYARDMVAAGRELPFLQRRFVDQLASSHVDGHRNYVSEIGAVLTLEAVDRLLVRGRFTNIACGEAPKATQGPPQ
jgi:asparagine synthase (glutamine-hydrolysing)